MAIVMRMRRLVTELGPVLHFICSLEFWWMAVAWTISLFTSYLHLFFQRIFGLCSNVYPQCLPPESRLSRLLCIVTGATSGLGAAAALALSREGFFVVLVGRSSKLLDRLLINNAGILATSYRITVDGFNQMMATNYVGAFSLTKLLLPLIRNNPVGARIVNVTSFTHQNVFDMLVDKETVSGKCFKMIKKYPFAHIYQYSKLCMLLFSYQLHLQLQSTNNPVGVSVNAADPGLVETNNMREFAPCLSLLACKVFKFVGLDAALAPPETSGKYFFGGKGTTLNSSSLSYNIRLAEKLWTTS